MEHMPSDTELRTAIRELRVRETEARKEGRNSDADEIAERIRGYQEMMGARL